MSVLHLVDPGAVGGDAMTLRFVADVLREGNRKDCVVVLGHRAHARLAQRCGLCVDALIPVPRRTRFRPTPGARRVIDAMARVHGPFVIVHAWSMRSEAFAARILPDKPCVISTMVGPQLERTFTERMAVHIAPAVLVRTAQLRFFVPHDGVSRELSAVGVYEDVVWNVQPGVDMSLLSPPRTPAREALRKQWGVSDDCLLVGLISQPIAWGNARAAASIVTLPVTANRDVKLLVHPDAERLQAAHEWARPLGFEDCLVQESDLEEPWRVMAGLDVALWLGNDRTRFEAMPIDKPRLKFGEQPLPGVLPILWAMAAGLPVIAERCAATEALIRDGETGMLIEPRDVPEGARHAIELIDHSERRRSLGKAAQREIESHFTIAHAATRLNDAYEQLLVAQRKTKSNHDDAAVAVRLPSSASAAST